MTEYNSKRRIEFCKHLGKSWQELADYFDIPVSWQQQYEPGQEALKIWAWLAQTGKLNELAAALDYIGRPDIVPLVLQIPEQNPPPKPPSVTGSPYLGPRAFREEESALFFGRDAEISGLLAILRDKRFVAVIGASASGKSSLVRAGILPRLKDIQAGRHWEYVCFTPGGNGGDPFLALASVLPTSLEKLKLSARYIARQLYKRGNIAEIVEQYLRQKPAVGQFLIFIDQFEELFTLVTDENLRQRFIKLLENAMQNPQLRIILTLRADFYECCLDYPAFARLINGGAWHLAAPDLTALWLMIQRPAEAAGLQFAAGLAEQILLDARLGSGGLALLAFTLEQLYQDRAPLNILTWEVYESLGGVGKAMDRHAQATYQTLDLAARATLDQVFAELVAVDPERGAATRKRADLARIGETPAARELIEAFIQARLLVETKHDGAGANHGAPPETVVEVAHEALLTHWDLLHNWIGERFGEFSLLRQVCAEAEEWRRRGCPESLLWPHERLQTLYDLRQKLKPGFPEYVCAFIRPEAERLLEKLRDQDLSHQQRERIGVRLAEIGDNRVGVGLDANGLPEFDWCPVPFGKVILEKNAGTIYVQEFHISRYPLTYRQYRAFVEAADGYRNADWWTGLKHESNPGEQFRKVANHPAENVSWFDAVAYCRWLSEKLRQEIRLPTEWEWRQAATGGDPQNAYPWGAEFDGKCCNTRESGIGRTTVVGLYPMGASPVGALDMSGNVQEWCANGYRQPKRIDTSIDQSRVVRGGSWLFDLAYARASSRVNSGADFRRNFLGFRVCRT